MEKSTKVIRVLPAILEVDIDTIEERFKTVQGLVSAVQVDVCDGQFVPSITFGATGDEVDFIKLKEFSTKYGLSIELDMMVEFGSDIGKWLKAIELSGAKAVVLHYGSVEDDVAWAEAFGKLADSDILVGLGVHIDTPLQDAVELFKQYHFNYIQVMGIERVGYGGQEFSNKAIDIIHKLQDELPGVPVSVDGGVNLNTIEQIKRAGVSAVAAGSAIYKADNKAEVIRLLSQ